MARYNAVSFCLALTIVVVAAVAQWVDNTAETEAQARQRALDQQKKDAGDAKRLDRMRFESAFADMIPPSRRLKLDVASGPEGEGIRVIVDAYITRDPRRLSAAGGSDGDEYLMDVQLQSPGGSVFAVRCNTSGCRFAETADGGYFIPGKLLAIPGDGCVYSTMEISGGSSTDIGRIVHCFTNGAFEVSQPEKGSGL